MHSAMRSFFILVLLCLVGWTNSNKCPAKYLRFTPHHSFCLPPNPSCQVTRTGVSQQDKDLILRLHNQFRSKVAMGNEHRSKGGSMPQAADMLQMEWDDELSAVAQKWTENCHWGHDCKECRAVENFGVGQNLALTYWDPCYGSHCRAPSNEPDWTSAITDLYDEVKDYYISWIGSFKKHPGPKTGHLTQLVWSRSWRVGCGYSYYKQNGAYYKYYACNYAPSGNFNGQPVYKQGRPCSACPTNTQCSISPRGPNSFPGLCKLNNPNIAPVYRMDPNGLLFHCSASSSDPDCQAEVTGDGSWKTVRSVGGYYDSIVLRGGQSTTLAFTKTIVPHANKFCLRITFQKGPLDASFRDQSSLQADYKMDNIFAGPSYFNSGRPMFTDSGINLGWGDPTKLKLTFSVPRGAGEHILDIRNIVAFDGSCDSRKN